MGVVALFRRGVGVAALLGLPVCAWAGQSGAPRWAEVSSPRRDGANPSTIQGAVETRTLALARAAPAQAEASDAQEARIIRVEIAGLRRISAAAVRAHITSSEGQPLDAARVAEDVRALNRLAWFDAVSAEVEPVPLLLADAELGAQREGEESRAASDAPTIACDVGAAVPALAGQLYGLRLIFVVEERPFLARVEFRGSRLLSRGRIEALLAEKRVALKVAAPANPTDLWRAKKAIEAALADAGHPRAQVRANYEPMPTAAVRAVVDIQDGPAIYVAQVKFAGNRAFPEKKLRRQLRRIAPDAHLADLRGKTIYTPGRMAEDLERVASFYRNHGYPEARLGQPTAEIEEERVRRWLPWPHRRTAPRFRISIPVDEGRFYRLTSVEVEREWASPAGLPSKLGASRASKEPMERPDVEAALRGLKLNGPYSEQAIERASELLVRLPALEPSGKRRAREAPAEVEVKNELNPGAGTARVKFHVREGQPYLVRQIEFTGQKRFRDRYFRRRILLKEGEAFDAARLKAGLAQLARAGFIKPVKRQDVRVRFDEARRTADVAIHVEEIGRQRFSLVGGHSGFGSTLGIVYNVFDLLGGEELITAHLEGGPESLQIMLGLAKEALFGTQASLGFSVYRNVVRPNLPGAAGRQHLFTSSSTGLALNTSYALTGHDTLGVSYDLAQNVTRYDLTLPPSVAGLPNNALQARTSSRSVGLRETRDTGRTRLDAGASVSGGWLGGSENLLRSSLEYARFQPDRLSGQRNAWAFRTYVAGVSSYRGDVPFHARFFPGEQLVRGFRAGELGPYAVVNTVNANGTRGTRAQTAGANLVGAMNAEYRMPVAPRAEAAAFLDAGSGWLLPGWLGPTRPLLLGATNGAWRSSTGMEMRWQVPVVDQTVRVYYAINPLRLARTMGLPDGSVFRPSNRRRGAGWALGTMF